MTKQNAVLMDQVNELFERGVIIDLDISWWSGQAKLRAEDIGIPKENINMDLFSLGRKRFIPKNWIGRFRKYEQKGRWVADYYSFQFKRGAGAFVPLTALPSLLEELNKCKENFLRIVGNFVEQYPTIKRKMIVAWGEEVPRIYKRMKSLGAELPSLEEFKQRFMAAVRAWYPKDPRKFFKYTWAFHELTLPREFSMTEVKIKKKLKKAELEKQKQRALIQKYNEGLNEQVNSFLGSVVRQLRGATVELAKRVRKQITDGSVTDNRLDRLREFIKKFSKLNFMQDSEVETALAELEKNLEFTAEEYKTNEELESALRGSLSAVIKIASRNGAEVLTSAFSRKRKVVRKR